MQPEFLYPFLASPNAAIDESSLKVGEAFGVAGQVVIVTGAAGWIGHKIAEVFTVNGAKVAMSDRAGEGLDIMARRLSPQGATAIPAELMRREDLVSLVAKTAETFGKIDALIHCGAIAASRPMMHQPEEDFDRLFHTNVKSAWILAREVLPHLQKTQGSIVNISSVNGHRPMFPGPLYAATKSGVAALSKDMAVEFGPFNVRVNTVSPGAIMAIAKNIEAMRKQLSPEHYEKYAAFAWEKIEKVGKGSQPLHRGGRPLDVALACVYLCSPAARFVSGADLLVDGAMTLQFPGHRDDPDSWWHQVKDFLRALPKEAWVGELPEWVQKK
jgi:NAD(P)-dependent dehydrogenase (short-subunit alcohol dehydrogenase family)